MKQEKEYSDHAMSKHQERTDRDHLQIEKLTLLEQEEEPSGSTMEEEHQVHPLRPSENMNDKEVW